MTVKSEVQGVVQALFGAYAGGYLAELTAEATANGTGAVAARLASVQGIILGRDLTSNATFINTILGNLGVNSLNPAYAAASKWATDAMAGGATRGDVVSSAVAFLEGVAAGTIVDAAYSDIAKAYATKVAAGVTYSETAAGSKVLTVADLQKAAGAVTPTDVAGVLTEQTTAAAAVTSFLAALDLNKDGAADGLAAGYTQSNQVTAVATNVETAEAAVDIALDGNFKDYAGQATQTPIIATTTVYNQNEHQGQTPAADATEDAAGVLITAQIGAERVVLNNALTNAIAGLSNVGGTAAEAAAADAAQKAKVDAYLAAVKAATAAADAQTLADIAADAAAASWDTATAAVSGVHPTNAVTYGNAGVEFTYISAGVTVNAAYNGTAWAYTSSTTNNNVVTIAPVVPATYPSDAVKSAAEALFGAGRSSDTADSVASARLTDAGSFTPGQGNGTANIAYADAAAYLTQFDAAVTKFNAALAGVTTARKIASDLVVLDKAVGASTAKLEAAGYTLQNLDNNNALLATTKSNLFNVAGLKGANPEVASITDFGAAGDDALIVTGYTKAASTKGDNNVLEFSVKQVGPNTVLSFENTAFGFADDVANEFTVTLTGVDSTKLDFADGLILG